MYYMSSRLNEHYPYLATDHDVHTCAETGHSRGSWWVQILPDAINVTSIVVTGTHLRYKSYVKTIAITSFVLLSRYIV